MFKITSIQEDDNKYWFSFLFVNALFSVDKNDKKLQYEGSLSGHPVLSSPPFLKFIKHNEYLYAVPFFSDSLVIYSATTKEFETITINQDMDKNHPLKMPYFQARKKWKTKKNLCTLSTKDVSHSADFFVRGAENNARKP